MRRERRLEIGVGTRHGAGEQLGDRLVRSLVPRKRDAFEAELFEALLRLDAQRLDVHVEDVGMSR